jgi:ornithine carbamoyltransferase
MVNIITASGPLKKKRGKDKQQPLAGQIWALIFTKSSTRTRVSFEVAIRELGGQVMFLSANDIQLGRSESIQDTARVLGRMVHGAVIRTYAQSDVEEFARYSKLPTINALTDDEHPCQILTDLFTFVEKRGSFIGKVITLIGDGASNMTNSWIFAAANLGFELRVAAPKGYQPAPEILERARAQSKGKHTTAGKIIVTDDIKAAAKGADMLYTDVWISMGKEAESAERIKVMTGYQINAALLKFAKPNALVMHCLPAYKGKEIDEETFEAHAQTIFDQAENRLHVQKAILKWVMA